MSITRDPLSAQILVVDDQANMRGAVKRILETTRLYQVNDCTSGDEAIAFLEKNTVDLVVSDIFMPRGDGFDILRFIRGRGVANDLPIIFFTGEGTKDDIVHAIDAGVNGYLLKPFEAQDLLAKIKTTLEQYRNPGERILALRQAEHDYILGHTEDSRRHFVEYLQKDPTSARALTGLALVEIRLGLFEESLKHLKEAVAENKMYFPAFASMADLAIARGEEEDAMQWLLQELEINAKQPMRRKILAKLYHNRGAYPAAIDQLRAALLESPRDEGLLLTMADTLLASGNLEKALHYFQRTRRQHPRCTQALDGMAKIFYQTGDIVKGIHFFTDLLRQHPGSSDIALIRAQMYEHSEEWEKALGDLESFLISEPQHAGAQKQKARNLAKLNRNEEAFEVLKTIATLQPEPENYAKVGLICLRLGKHDTAREYYQRAVTLMPNNTKYLFNLGFAFESLQMAESAINCFRKVVELDPENQDAKDAIRRASIAPKKRPGGAP